jgi:superfamily II DNA or RNA helicase
MEPKEKSIIKGDFFPEPVEVIKVDKRNGGVIIYGRLIHSGDIRNWFLTEEDLREITIQSTDFSAKGSEAFLATEALRLRYAYLFDPYLAVSVSKIDPLPFQIEAVYEYALKLPQVRFMIADDPGAGKTIMAGLIIKKLKLRGLARRILIVELRLEVIAHRGNITKQLLQNTIEEGLRQVGCDIEEWKPVEDA